MARCVLDRNLMFQFVCLAVVLFCMFGPSEAIRCYKCKGDDECDFKTRQIYVENCTWATKCWGARIGDHFIRSCADDRCDLQIGVGSYVESKCCYTDMCNNENFFFPNKSSSIMRTTFQLSSIFMAIFFFQYFARRLLSCF